MKMARKRYKLLLPAILLVLFSAPGASAQDVLNSNPNFWGPNGTTIGFAAEPAVEETPAPPRHVILTAQVDGIIRAARNEENNNRFAESQRLYEQAIQLAPKNRKALLSFARMLHRLGNLDASISMYYRSLEHHRDDAVAMNDLALCYARKGDLQHALAMLNGALSLKPESKRYRNNIAKVLVEMDRPNDAFAHLVEANGPAMGHFGMGQLLAKRGRLAEASTFLEIALGLDPSLTPAIELLREIRTTAAPVQAPRIVRLPATNDGGPLRAADKGSPLDTDSEQLGESVNLWMPGSIKLQSAEIPLPNKSNFMMAGYDELEEQSTSLAPVPFESPTLPRRYTPREPSSDSVGSFLDGF